MKFVEKSFIVTEKISLALVDARITYPIEKKLNEYGINILKTPPCNEAYNAIKYHPDIALCKLNNKNIVVAPNVYDAYNKLLNEYGFNIIKGSSLLAPNYPNNIQYNIALFGKYAIHNFKYTDNKILEYINNNNFIKIQVNQGYSKCSICIIDENSIITSDEGIYSEVIKYNIDCLLIEKGHIDLFDLNYGFIGGCSGMISNDKIAVFGNINNHPNCRQIKEFINKKGKEVVSLSEEALLDLGSLIPLKY